MRTRMTLFAVLVAVCCLCGNAFATTYYVAPSGSDADPGTSGQPWATLQHAADTMLPGDTTLVASGTYDGFRAETVGQAGAPITIAAASGAVVLVDAPGPINRHASNIEVENYDVRVQYWVIDGLESFNSARYGIDIRTADYITVQNCYTHDNASTGIFLAFADYPTIQYNETSYNGEHGIYDSNSGDYPTLRGNNSHHNYACGIHMNGDASMGGDGLISYALVEQNVLWENGNPGGGSAINCDGVMDSIFRNNLAYNNYASGISLYSIDGAQGSSRNKVYNNTFYFPSGGRNVVNIPKSGKGRPSPTGNEIFNNVLYTANTSKCSIWVYSTAALAGSNNNAVVDRFCANGKKTIPFATWRTYGFDAASFLATPAQLFVDPASSNFHLKTGSLAANTGTTLAEVTDDLDGEPRPQGSAYDIGCYEDW
jgi:parallel beta-helix repeat protein